MSSRAAASSSGGVRVKSERQAKVKVEKGANGRSQRNRVESEEEEEDAQERGGGRASHRQQESEDDDEEEEEGTPRGNKRQRVNDNGDSRSSRAPSEDAEEDEDEDEGEPRARLPKVKTQPRDTDGFIPGSIVRIQLKNFVTYDFVEFRPGPYLNMIVGPNGTGKSSIACAIALGLNFPPKVLGRASELNAFVKQGTDKGYIEIELKGFAGKPNLVIRRELTAKNKGSSFSLNGQPATGREVSEKMAALNVQVENLCSFLPQDKVSSFAHMTPQQLLVETQKAAGDPNLSSWFETLKDEGKQLKLAQQKLKEDENTLAQLKKRNENIEHEVERIKEKQKIEEEIQLLESLILTAHYREVGQQYTEAKEKRNKAHKKMLELKARNEPAHKLEKDLEKAAGKASERRSSQKRSMQDKAKALKKKQEDSDAQDALAENIQTDLDNLKTNEKNRLAKIRSKEHDLAQAKEDLAKPPPNLPDPNELQEEMKQINLEKAALTQEVDERNNEIRAVVNQKVTAMEDVRKNTDQLRRLDTADAKKLGILAKWDAITHGLMEVFEPPILSVSVRDVNYAAFAEAGFSAMQMKTFVAQCQEDLDTLNHWVNDTDKALGRRVRIATYFRTQNPQSVAPPPMSHDEMRAIGFEGYLIDLLEYPEGMAYWLKGALNLHRIAISPSGRADVTKAMELYGKSGGGVFINGSAVNNVSRSRYGNRAVGNMTREMNMQAKNFVVPPVDTAEKARLETAIREAQGQAELLEQQKVELQGLLDAVNEKDKDIRKRADAVTARRQAIKNERDRVSKLEVRKRRLEEDLARLKNAPSAEQERKKLKDSLVNVSKKRIKIAREYTDLARSIYKGQLECTNAGLEWLQALTNHTALKALCAEKDAKYTQAVAKFNDIHEQFGKLKQLAHEAITEVRARLDLLDEVNPDLRARVNEMERVRSAYDLEVIAAKKEGRPPPSSEGIDLRTYADLEAEIAEQKAAKEMILNTNPGVIEEFEKRKRDIEGRERTIEGTKLQIRRHEKKIKMHRDQWEPALDALITSICERFSAAFDSIGCAGEVKLGERVDDFEQWCIEIFVKFRDTERMTLLTGQRQSGGERSLTTILYLMALTEEARAPFSLVDEINQGMDQRAERVVHNSMVNVTCKEDAAQYFLITPKLLTDLNYHERMKILCVNNGEWLPEERGVGNMMGMIEGFVARARETGRAPGSA
ncbi:P-loop containing nucleoside triphosphate hydrolase protein [Coprinellus micaceus]|uniref:Structural maintenance of chromosomes protein 5 n=1 Tax=Coprinellus micaceus TaxID=71717 RepID=A0A4Y7SR72_COPMI|nr:P-loop containing nucleoside triphosphate hydrolase protein [Coprinellus micaceus]